MNLKRELCDHLPFTIYCVALGIIGLGILTFIANLHGTVTGEAFHGLYHIFHPIHLLFSASATTAMVMKYDKKILKAILIGSIGSVGVCGLSDIILPYAASYLLGVHSRIHICLIEHPIQIIPFLIVGLLVGVLITPAGNLSTIFSHVGHVLVSSMASILYLVAFGLTNWIHYIGLVFVFMIIAVVIPCCTSDIILPLLLMGKGGKHE